MLTTIDSALVPHAADGDGVSSHEGHELQADYSVEGDSGAKVDEREEASASAGKDDGV